MPKIRIDFLVMETFERLFGASALLEVLDRAIPEIEWQEREALQRLAHQEQWDVGDYEVARDNLDAKFRRWLPRLAPYAVIIMLHSIVETQLVAFAERVGRTRESTLRVKDISGRGIRQAALYLERVAALDVKKDPGWRYLRDLQEIRNIVVHRGGKPGQPEEPARSVNRLMETYEGKVLLPKGLDGLYGDLWVSMHLCREFAQEIEEFFKRLFKSAGLPDEGAEIVE